MRFFHQRTLAHEQTLLQHPAALQRARMRVNATVFFIAHGTLLDTMTARDLHDDDSYI